jgi:hypothetical protein
VAKKIHFHILEKHVISLFVIISFVFIQMSCFLNFRNTKKIRFIICIRCLCNVLMNNIYFKFRFTNPCHSRSAVGNFPCEFHHYKQKPVRRGGQTQRTAYKTHAYLPAIPAMASDAEYLTSISLSIVSFSRTGLTWG